jgi:hypothetical protein
MQHVNGRIERAVADRDRRVLGRAHDPRTNGFLRRIWGMNVTLRQVPPFDRWTMRKDPF